MAKVGEGKFFRMFGRSEIRLTACAVTKHVASSSLLGLDAFSDYFSEPNQFWQRDPNHERALLKIYKRDLNLKEQSTFWDPTGQIVEIPMPFWGNNSADGWGELQFLIKEPKLVRLARSRSFDTRVNKWVEETKLIQPKTDLETHSYLSLRFYHQDYLPPVPADWHFEPVYISISNSMYYRVDVLWEEDIEITTMVLDKDSLEIPKHLK